MTKTKKNKMRGGDMTMPSNNNNTISNTSNNIMNWMSNAWTKTKSESKGLFDKLGEQTKGMMNNTKDFMNKQNSTVAPLNTTETTVVNPVGGKKKVLRKDEVVTQQKMQLQCRGYSSRDLLIGSRVEKKHVVKGSVV